MLRRALASSLLLLLAADQIVAALALTRASAIALSAAFGAGLAVAALGVMLRSSLARLVALGAGLAALSQAVFFGGFMLSWGVSPPTALVTTGAASALVIALLAGRRMAEECDRGLPGQIFRREGAAPRWLAASVVGASAAVPMLLVYAFVGPSWVSDAHRLVACALAVGFAAAGMLVALERTAGALLYAPLAVMTLVLVVDSALWLAATSELGLSYEGAGTASTLAPVLFGAIAALGAIATLGRPVARFLRAA